MELLIGILLSFTAAFAWGSSMVIFKVGLKETEPLIATYVRGLAAIPILLILGLSLYGWESFIQLFIYPNVLWLFLAALSILLGDFFSLIALKKINVSIAQPISAIYPLFTSIILLAANIEEITLLIGLGTAIVVLGISILSYFSQQNNKEVVITTEEKSNKKKLFVGVGFSILAALFWGATIVFSRLILEDPQVKIFTMMGVRNGFMVFATFIFVVIRTVFKKNRTIRTLFPKKREAFILIGGGAISWCIGGVSFFNAVLLIGAHLSTPLSSISPLVVTFLGVIFLKEKINLLQVGGIILTITGTILISLSA
ncbi:MAG: DMT family transporter [Candidatus Heimdallarchaeaceae archaeon]